MRFLSRQHTGVNYRTDAGSSYTSKRFRNSTSATILIAFVAVLAWAFSPLASDTNYIAVSSANNKQNAAVISNNANLVEQSNALTTDSARSFLAEDQPVKSNTELQLAKISSADTALEDNIMPKPTPVVGTVKSFVVESGDTLSKIFKEAGVPLVQAINLDRTPEAKDIRSLKPGREMRFFFDSAGQWETLEYTLSKLKTLIIKPEQDQFEINTHEKAVTYETVSSSGLINSHLGAAGEEAGLTYSMVSKLVDVFKWEIDFARDIQAGDRFHLIYEKGYVDNEFIADGGIIAAEFWNRGSSIQAVRYENNNGDIAYYKPDGESLKRGFLRTPVTLGRVTSGFSKRRLHPIKNTWKAHKGVDYGAKRGTSILATGDGVVQYAGKKGGYGNTVILRHGGNYTTLYAHMNKFGKGIRTGKRVTQGQTIGYVGATGWATGPHLHYEFRINGRHKNPLKVEFPRTNPVASNEMAKFKATSKQHLNQLSEAIEIKTAQR